CMKVQSATARGWRRHAVRAAEPRRSGAHIARKRQTLSSWPLEDGSATPRLVEGTALHTPVGAHMTREDSPAVRLRRSVLFLPGGNARALEKARQLPADALIFDLEDAVAPQRKVEARSLVASRLREGGYGPRECVVRINGVDSEWFDGDAAALATMPASGVLLPKV